MNVSFVNDKGEKQYVYLGSYGIGITRMIGVLAEVFHDDRGLIWPESVAPFQFHLIGIGESGAEEVYKKLTEKGFEVLYDDRDIGAGEKFADADLIGIPTRLVVSPKTGAGKVEVKKRNEEKTEIVSFEKLFV